MASPDTLYIEKINEVYNIIDCEPSVAQELCDYFTFEVPGARFMPAYRSRVWDGKIRLYSTRDKLLYGGLLKHTLKFAKSRNYDTKIVNPEQFLPTPTQNIEEFINSLSLPFAPRDYQIMALEHAIQNEKCVLLSPTASGKSLIIHLIIQYFSDRKCLIVVPTTSLVEQMFKDFESYGINAEKYFHKLYSGQEKTFDKQNLITTWQSIFRKDLDFFEPYEVVIGDEAHGFKAKSLTDIMTKLVNCSIRVGTTGTLDGTKTHKFVLEGLFGPVFEVTTSKKLMEEQHLAELKIHCIILKHSDEICKEMKTATYQQEINYIVGNNKRNSFICDMVENLTGNTLILYQLVEKHGEKLYQMLKEKTNKKVSFIHGGISANEREDIRMATEQETNSILVASYGTYSTGINIRNLHNVVFASPSKSRIRNLQSIGRALRRTDDKIKANLFDLSDDISHRSRNNYTLNHMLSRLKIYNDQKFDYTIKKFNL